jgi:glycosyltransferase involved in cell wall biosynthesis
MSADLPSCLVITFNSLEFDSRVKRQVGTLCNDFAVTLLAPNPRKSGWWDGVEEHIYLDVQREGLLQQLTKLEIFRLIMRLFLLLGVFQWFHWSPQFLSYWGRQVMSGHIVKEFDLIVVNDVEPIPLAFDLSNGAPVLADLHEFAPGQSALRSIRDRAVSRYSSWICQKYLAQCAGVTVVSNSVRNLYHSNFGVDSRVVRNVPDFVELSPSAVTQRDIQFVHHGHYSPGRGIELIVEAFATASDIGTLNLVLAGAPLERLKSLGWELGIPSDRIVFHDFVSPELLVPFLSQFDVEVIFTPTNVKNQAASLPNKFLEAIQARLGVVTGPSPEIARVINSHRIGVVVPSFSPRDLAIAFRAISSAEVRKWKKHSDGLSGELNWQNEAPDYRRYLR